MFKKLIAVLLAVSFVFGFTVFAQAEESHNAKLYTIYADGMLFQQNKESTLAGTGKPGDKITAELYHGKKLVTSGESTVGTDGKFTVSFTAPKGSYTQYVIMIKENDKYTETLTNIVFGELWLASGQSNMMYPLAQSVTGIEMFEKQEKLSPWLRVLLVPGYPEYKGETALTRLPLETQEDITDAEWVTGEDFNVYNVSAVAYFFAVELMKKLDMPVGILNSSLGGSSVASWLSRETCESDREMTDYLAENGLYFTASEWNERNQDVYTHVTANYNQKIHPLRHFRPTGMIWYQGETDIWWTDGMYGRAFTLMQKSYSELFGFEDSLMPIVYTQLAPYNYGSETILSQRNNYYTVMQQEYPDSRAVISIHDLPLTYIMAAGIIHPQHKEEVGQRMFFAAEGLVYGKRETYTVSTIKSTEIKDGSIFVTLDNIGDGLKADGNKITGFAICDKSGIYVQAEAEIVSTDTVRIYAKNIENPVSASYAYCPASMRSNLYATENGRLALPVGPFVTDGSYMTKTWRDLPWTECDDKQTWFNNNNDPYGGYYDSWESENAELTFSRDFMNVKGSGDFDISPTISYEIDGKKIFHQDSQRDFSDYGKLTFSIRNNGEKDVTFDSFRIYRETFMWYSPEANGGHDSSVVIPADGEWHKVTLDLNALYLYANECGIISPNNMIKYIQDMKFCFVSEGEADVDLDNFRFAPEEEDTSFYFETKLSDADNFLEFISAMFSSILSIFFRGK